MADRGTETKPAREKPSGAKAVAGWFNMAGSRLRNMPLHNTPHTSRDADAKQIDYNDSIRATYLTLEELADCGEALARDKTAPLPGYQPFEFRPVAESSFTNASDRVGNSKIINKIINEIEVP